MSLIRWSPFHAFGPLPPGASPWPHADGEREPLRASDWRPAVDIYETPEHFEVTAELPGVDKADVTVRLDDGVLTIAGERRPRRGAEGLTAHRVERAYGRFERSFTLPPAVDDERVAAELQHGLLRLRIGKRPPPTRPTGRRIEIG